MLISHAYRRQPESRESAAGYARQRSKVERALLAMSQDLGASKFCHGERFSLADIAAGYALGYLDSAVQEIDWRRLHPNLKGLADRLGVRESFRNSLPPAA